MARRNDFFDNLCLFTERILTHRRKTKRLKKEKLLRKNPVVDWLEAFLWAAGVVLLINQYLFQAYQIPSGSMIDTLMIRDRIFVNKLVYGPELLPGTLKIPSPIKPERNQVVIFENPSYISRGPAFDIAQRIIYMLTLSMVDIDKDENGEPKAHFLIKRAAGMEGDRFVTHRGDMLIQFSGKDDWIPEGEYKEAMGLDHTLSRLTEQEAYPAIEAAGKAAGYMDLGLNPPEGIRSLSSRADTMRYIDYFSLERSRLEVLRGAFPQDPRYKSRMAQQTMGWYVPEGYAFPLGDNRDNSRDGRYFGPVRLSKILGQGAIIYWPLGRMGIIR